MVLKPVSPVLGSPWDRLPQSAARVLATERSSAIVSKMPTFEKHCEQTSQILGDRFEQVHLWLDEFAGKEPYGMRHRRKRHHAAGIEEVRKMFGDAAAEAARIHIEMDLREEGWTPSDSFPKDERHFVSIGFY